jgi:hypothetical protein
VACPQLLNVALQELLDQCLVRNTMVACQAADRRQKLRGETDGDRLLALTVVGEDGRKVTVELVRSHALVWVGKAGVPHFRLSLSRLPAQWV